MKNISDEFKQAIAESENNASMESALDLLNRSTEFAIELNRLIRKQELPSVLIIGILENAILIQHDKDIKNFHRLMDESKHEQ